MKLGGIPPYLFIPACPLSMVFMMGGMHNGHDRSEREHGDEKGRGDCHAEAEPRSAPEPRALPAPAKNE